MPVRVDYRRHWREPAFWRWVWRERIPLGGKILVAFGVACLLAAGGYATESVLPAQAATGNSDSGAITIVRTYTVRGPTRTVVHRLTTPARILHRTVYVTRTVRSRQRTVTVVRDVPHVVTHAVTAAGRPRTRTVVQWRTSPARTDTVTTTVPLTVVETTTVHGHGDNSP